MQPSKLSESTDDDGEVNADRKPHKSRKMRMQKYEVVQRMTWNDLNKLK